MRRNLRSLLLLLIPVFVFLFIQAQNGRGKHLRDTIRLASASATISLPELDTQDASSAFDDDNDDDISETLMRLIPAATIIGLFSFFLAALQSGYRPVPAPVHSRNGSLSFLSVFRI